VSNTEVTGSVTSGNFCGKGDVYTAYFDIVFSQPFVSNGTWQGSTLSAGADSLNLGSVPASWGYTSNPAPATLGDAGAYLTFDTSSNDNVQAKVGLSYVSTANAADNLQTENPGWDFAGTQAAATAAWNQQLLKADIGGASSTDAATFYTALYHSLLDPSVFSDDNGQYPGFDGKVHTVAAGHAQYADFSGWDIYRDQIPLLSLLDPSVASDAVQSDVNDYDQSGQLIKWSLDNGETYEVIGDNSDPIIAQAYAFGATDFDTATALSAMIKEATVPNNVRPGLAQYLADGYVPSDDSDAGCCDFQSPASTTQEYETDDEAIAQFAADLGDTSDATTFSTRANGWVNQFNPTTGYVQAKQTNGEFDPGFTPSTTDGFKEATSAQSTPANVADVAGTIAAVGGDAAWDSRLNSLIQNIASPSGTNADFSNEPSLEIPWEYDFTGDPSATEAANREVEDDAYTDADNGLLGNDDLGGLSSDYVWSTLGFFPFTPGSDQVAMGSPRFPLVQLTVGDGKTLMLNAPAATPTTPYITALTVNGQVWNHAYLPISDLTGGGELDYTMSGTPSTTWGTAPSDAPASDQTGLAPAVPGLSSTTASVLAESTSTTSFALRSLSTAAASTVSWTATATDGLTVTPSSGTVSVPAGGDPSQSVTLGAPSGASSGTVSFAFTSATGGKIAAAVLPVTVGHGVNLSSFYNSIGVTDDGGPGVNFDGSATGYSYSAQALAAAGITPGGSVVSNGVTYTWPSVPSDTVDNVAVAGQTVPLPATPGATRIGFLGVATKASPGFSGTATVKYTDGTSSTFTLGLTDWTYNGGSVTAPVYGEHVVATMPYRDKSGTTTTQNATTTYLLATDFPLNPAKTAASITLPSAPPAPGAMHVFSIGLQPADGALASYYNNTGITDTGGPGADFDTRNYSYSTQALAAAGIVPGGTVVSDGVSYEWPSVAADEPDNVTVAGQTIPLTSTPGASKIGFLGVATKGTPAFQGAATINYTDGTTSTINLGFTDWTYDGGAVSAPVYGEQVVATLPYRNSGGVGSTATQNATTTYLLAADFPIDPTKTVASITLPASPASPGLIHIFAIGFGSAGGPTASLPESPFAAGLPLLALGVVGISYFGVSRRRRS
jgi:predicted alpha-1,2-mannosidase